jgi:hypothetical protein
MIPGPNRLFENRGGADEANVTHVPGRSAIRAYARPLRRFRRFPRGLAVWSMGHPPP